MKIVEKNEKPQTNQKQQHTNRDHWLWGFYTMVAENLDVLLTDSKSTYYIGD